MKNKRLVTLMAWLSLVTISLFFALPVAKEQLYGLLCHAARRGDITTVKLCLLAKFDLDKWRITERGALSGPSAFLCATDSGNIDIVALLLASGANPNPRGPNPLIGACYRGHYDVAKLLLEHGADPNANGNNNGDGTPLSAATGHPKIIELLRSHGAKE